MRSFLARSLVSRILRNNSFVDNSEPVDRADAPAVLGRELDFLAESN